MDETAQTAGNPDTPLRIAHGRIGCSLRREGGRLTIYQISDADTGMSWACGKWDFLLTLEQNGRTFTATEADVSESGSDSTMVDNSWRFALAPRFDDQPRPACSLMLELRISATGDWLEEQLVLRNDGASPLKIAAFRAMPSRSLDDVDVLCFPVPFESCRSRPEILSLRENESFECNRDGAVLLCGSAGLVIARRATASGKEQHRLVEVRRTDSGFSFAGAAMDTPGDGDHVVIEPGACRDWGVTRYIPYRGTLEDGLPRYRDFMATGGPRPPVNGSSPSALGTEAAESHDERWSFEFMLDPFDDFKSGRLFNLYFYNLCYEKPLYLHVDLSKDVDHPAVFWYKASTVRHLEMGSYDGLADEQKAHVRKMLGVYNEHREFFTIGRFSGPDPLTHIHVLPGKGAVVMKFNDKPEPARGRIELTKEQVACQDGIRNCVELLGADVKLTRSRDRIICDYVLKEYQVMALVARRKGPRN